MCDFDVVDRARALIGAPTTCYSPSRPGKTRDSKPAWVATITGPRALGWMMTLYPLMGERRKAKIRELIALTPKPKQWYGRKESDLCRHGHQGALYRNRNGHLNCRECLRLQARAKRARARERRKAGSTQLGDDPGQCSASRSEARQALRL